MPAVTAMLWISMLSGTLAPMQAPGGRANLPVLVLLQNDANVPVEVAVKAQAEAARLARLIGVEIVWVTEIPAVGRKVRVVSLVRWEPADRATPESVMGLTYAGGGQRGRLAYVFWSRVERTAQKFTVSTYNLLAAAIAHELGHMLMPDGSHARRGLMGESWNSADLRSVSAGLLTFSADSGERIRRVVLEEGRIVQTAGPAR